MTSRLRRERWERGLPIWKFAAMADVHPTIVSMVERRLQAAGRSQQERLARALGLRPEELFDERGFAREAPPLLGGEETG